MEKLIAELHGNLKSGSGNNIQDTLISALFASRMNQSASCRALVLFSLSRKSTWGVVRHKQGGTLINYKAKGDGMGQMSLH